MRRHAGTILFAALAAFCMAALGATSAHADQISVQMDKARPLRIAEPAATIAVGNPLIADAAILDSQTLLITGKSYGVTNLIAFDANGDTIFEVDLAVTEAQAPQVSVVSLYRGTARSSYACANGGTCQSQAMIGDSDESYTQVAGQRSQQLSASSAEAEADLEQ